MLLKMMTLLSATVEIDKGLSGVATSDGKDDKERRTGVCQDFHNMHLSKRKRKVTLRYDDVGYLLGGTFCDEEEEASILTKVEGGVRRLILGENINQVDADSTEGNCQVGLEAELKRPFALPTPARQALLSSAMLLLSKKGMLRSVSNTAIFVNGLDTNRYMLIVNHRALLRMLLRTAPYLDEYKAGRVPYESSSHRATTLKRTVNLIRGCRRFFDQGVQHSVTLAGVPSSTAWT